MKHHSQNQKGFTLIELLVVIAIIGVLSSIILVSVKVARAKGLDSKRLSEVIQLRNALETYNIDNDGYPPCASNPCTGTAFNTALSGILSGKYMSTLPQDPLNTGQYVYTYQTDVASGKAKSGIITFIAQAKATVAVPNFTEAVPFGSPNAFPSVISVNEVIGAGTVNNP